MGARDVGREADDMGKIKPIVWMVLGPMVLTVLLVAVDQIRRSDAAVIEWHEARLQQLQDADTSIRERIAHLEGEVTAARKASEESLQILRQTYRRP